MATALSAETRTFPHGPKYSAGPDPGRRATRNISPPGHAGRRGANHRGARASVRIRPASAANHAASAPYTVMRGTTRKPGASIASRAGTCRPGACPGERLPLIQRVGAQWKSLVNMPPGAERDQHRNPPRRGDQRLQWTASTPSHGERSSRAPLDSFFCSMLPLVCTRSSAPRRPGATEGVGRRAVVGGVRGRVAIASSDRNDQTQVRSGPPSPVWRCQRRVNARYQSGAIACS